MQGAQSSIVNAVALMPVPVGQVFWTARTGYSPACRGGVPKADLGNQRRISLKQQHWVSSCPPSVPSDQGSSGLPGGGHPKCRVPTPAAVLIAGAGFLLKEGFEPGGNKYTHQFFAGSDPANSFPSNSPSELRWLFSSSARPKKTSRAALSELDWAICK